MKYVYELEYVLLGELFLIQLDKIYVQWTLNVAEITYKATSKTAEPHGL